MKTPEFKKWFANYDTYRKTHQQIAEDAWQAALKDRDSGGSFINFTNNLYICIVIYAAITLAMFLLFGNAPN